MAVNAITNRVYVAHANVDDGYTVLGPGSVSVIDGVTRSVTTVPIGGQPSAIAVNELTNRIYVLNTDSGTVDVIDGATNAVTSLVVDEGGYGIAVNRVTNQVYVGSYRGVCVIDGTTNAVHLIALNDGEGARSVVVNETTNRIYVACAGRVGVVDGATLAISTVAVVGDGNGMAVNSTTNRIYVTSMDGDTITVIDGSTNTAKSVFVGGGSSGVAVNSATNKIYFCTDPTGWDGTMGTIDGATDAVTTVLVGGEVSCVAVCEAANKACFGNVLSNTSRVVDGATGAVGSVAVGGDVCGVAVNETTKRAYFVSSASNVVADVNLVAGLAQSYALHYTAGTGGTISGTANQTVASGASGTAVTAVANTGYHFVSWSDGKTTAARTDSNVTASATYSATFAINTYTLTYTAGPNGTISGASPQTVNYNGSGTAVTAVPNTGYHFVNWSDGSTQNPRTDGNVTSDKSVSAVFAANAPGTLSLIYTAGPGGTISGISSQSVTRNGSGTAVTAVPSVGYRFVSWSDDVATATRTDSNVTGNVTVTATFALKIKTSLTIRSDRTTSTRGHSIVFSGKISPTSVASGTRITIWMRKSGHAWAKWGTAYTNGSDNWSFTVYNGTRAHGTYYIRVKYAGNSTYLSSYSPYKTVYIK